MNTLKRQKSVKQLSGNLHSETAENCMVTQEWTDNFDEVKCTLRCDYCGRFTKDSDLTDYWIRENYWICKRCKEKRT